MRFDVRPLVERIKRDRRIVLWVVGVLLFITVFPALTFFSNQAASGPDEAPGADTSSAFDPGDAYATREVFSLPAPVDDGLATALYTGGTSPVTVEVVAPTGDGRYWVVDHPEEVRTRARVRVLDGNGEEAASFEVGELATLFTPGPDMTLWAVAVDPEDASETVVAFGADGAEVARLPVPDKVYARAIIFGRGNVYVLNEEWAYDPETYESFYAGSLHPVAIGKMFEPAVGDDAEPLAGAVFFSASGDMYVIERDDSGSGEALAAHDVAGNEVARIALPTGFRPYAVDDFGRVYMHGYQDAATDAPGDSILGDGARESVELKVIDRSNAVTTLSLPAITMIWGWTPPAWPTADGKLVTWTCGPGAVDVLELEPTTTGHNADWSDPFDAALTVIYPFEPASGDPYQATGDDERDLLRLVYSGLVSFDEAMEPIPQMAETVPSLANGGVSADGLTLTYELRDGQIWHDGIPVTGQDVVDTWRYLAEDPVAGPEPFEGFGYIEDVTAVGLQVTVKLSEPFGPGPECFFPFVLPGHIISGEIGVQNGGVTVSPVGSGPYRLVRWEPGSRWLLEAADSVQDTGAVDSLEVAFATGEDLQRFLGQSPSVWVGLTSEDALTLERDGLATVSRHLTGRWVGSVFNVQDEELADDDVRRALVDTYPFEALAEGVYATDGPVDPFLPQTDAHSSAAVVDGSQASASTAALLLSEADVSITLSHASRDGLPELIPEQPLVVEEAWSAAGVGVVRGFSTPSFYASWWYAGFMSAQDFSVSMGVFRAYPDAGWGGVFDSSDRPSGENPWGEGAGAADDAELVELFRRARASYDPAERDAISRAIAERIVQQDYAIFDYYERQYTAISRGVSGVQPAAYPAGVFWNVTQWRIEE